MPITASPFGYIYTLVNNDGIRINIPGQLIGLRLGEYFNYPDTENYKTFKRYKVTEHRDMLGNVTTAFNDCFSIICEQIG